MKKFCLFFLMLVPMAQAELKSGFFAGAQIGGGLTNGDHMIQQKETGLADLHLNEKKGINLSPLSVGLFSGYLFKIHGFGIAPEISIAYQGGGRYDFNQIYEQFGGGDNYHTKISQELTYSIGGLVRLGYVHDSYFIYGLVGADFQKQHYRLMFTTENDLRAGSPPVYANHSCFLSGITWGLGAQKEVLKNWHVGTEIRWTQFNKKTLETSTVPNLADNFITSQFKNNRFALILKVSHHF